MSIRTNRIRLQSLKLSSKCRFIFEQHSKICVLQAVKIYIFQPTFLSIYPSDSGFSKIILDLLLESM